MKNIIVTGANRGIGLEFVKQLAGGFNPATKNIFATCRNPEDAKELLDIQTQSKNVNVHLVRLDVTDNSQIVSATKLVEDTVGKDGINLLINNAGYCNSTKSSAFPNIEPNETAKHFAINTIGPILLAQAFFPLLKTAATNVPGGLSCNKAAIVNISSTISSIEQTNSKSLFPILPYKASKTALNVAMKAIAHDIKDDGILVILFCPGWVKTDMGGARAMLTVDTSVSSILKTMNTLNESNHGSFISRDGKAIPW